MADFDAVVIGAGNNGLMCALLLARGGWRVLVLEQASDVGGAARTGEVTLPGFKHDLFATNFTSFTTSPAYHEVEADLAELGVRFLYGNHPYASAYPNGTAARVYRDAAMTETEMARHSPADLAGWRQAVGLFARTAATFLPLHATPLPSFAMVRQLGRIAAGHPADTAALARLLLQSPRQFVDRTFASGEVKGLFTPWAFHLDFAPDVRGGATFAFIAALAAHLRGLNLVEGGAGRLMQALRVLIERAGGQVMTDAMVARIEVREGRAVGVRLARGEVVTAEKAVIANVTPRRLFGDLVPAESLSPRASRRIGAFRYAVGTFVLHLALGAKLAWTAADDLAEFSYVHLNGTMPEIEQTYAQAASGLIPARPMLIVSQTSGLDPTRAPPGQHVVRVHARAFPARIEGDAAGRIAARDWDAAKEAVADRLLALLAEHAPNLGAVLLARHAVSPLDLERGNPNLVGGDCNGGSHHLDQYYFARPARGFTRYRTPIERLHMIGASQWPGSGVNAASGFLLAKQLLT